jgi:hypothetical protein
MGERELRCRFAFCRRLARCQPELCLTEALKSWRGQNTAPVASRSRAANCAEPGGDSPGERILERCRGSGLLRALIEAWAESTVACDDWKAETGEWYETWLLE